MSGQTALLLGATGAVGKNLLKELLNSSQFTRVGEFGRRTTPLDTEGLNNTEKLVQKTVNFEKLSTAGFTEEKWDVIFITMGTTRKRAGSMENFVKIDQDYVVEAARVAKDITHKQQRLVYLSSMGANSASRILFQKSKGQTEERLASLGYSDTIVFRPGILLAPERDESSYIETFAQWFATPLTALSDKVGIRVKPLAKSIRIAGELGSSALPPTTEAVVLPGSGAQYTMIANHGCVRLSQQS